MQPDWQDKYESKEKLKAALHKISPIAWITDNEFVNENQKPFEFSNHRFMLQPYTDMSPEQVIMKSAQIGWSVLAILRTIHAAAYADMNVIYVLPTRNAAGEFVVPKVDPMIERNPELARLVKGVTNNKAMKQIGDRFAYFRGSFSERDAISTSADLIVSDETDRSDQRILTIYESRLQASEHGWYWRFSNPSLPGFGVHELYQKSDQMHWFVKCRKCQHTVWMDFKRDDAGARNHYVDEERQIYACGGCHKEITVAERQNGFWLAKYPKRELRGYWINQLMVPWVSAKKVLKQQASMDTQTFYNFVLGLPYQESEFMINRENILAACVKEIADKEDVFIGVDVGKEKHYVIGNDRGVFAYGKTESWEEIESLRNIYDATMVIDALPDFTIPEKLAKDYPGKVYVHFYGPENAQTMHVSQKKEGLAHGAITSDRTKLFDLLAADIVNKSIVFYVMPKDLTSTKPGGGLIEHCENAYRVAEKDTKGILKARWETKEGGPDHWLHALAYYRVATSFGIRTGETGGVRPDAPIGGAKLANTAAKDGTIEVEEVLGDFDEYLERSINKQQRKRR